MNIGDYVVATDDLRQPLGEHLVNSGTHGYVVAVCPHAGIAYPYEVLWNGSRKTCWVSSFDVKVVKYAEVETEDNSETKE